MITDILLPKSVKQEVLAYIEKRSLMVTEVPKILYDYYGPFGHITQVEGVIPTVKLRHIKRPRTRRTKSWLGITINI